MSKSIGYLYLIFISSILLVVSEIKEYSSCECKSIKYKSKLKANIYKFSHLLVMLYLSTFIILFNYTNDKINVYIYLIFSMFIVFHWNFFGWCILTLLEMKHYDLNKSIEKYKPGFHPTISTIFGKWDKIVLNSLGVLMLINVTFVLYRNINIYKSIKIIYYILFLYLFLNSTVFCKNIYYTNDFITKYLLNIDFI